MKPDAVWIGSPTSTPRDVSAAGSAGRPRPIAALTACPQPLKELQVEAERSLVAIEAAATLVRPTL